MNSDLCPKCGAKKNALVACPSCGYTSRSERNPTKTQVFVKLPGSNTVTEACELHGPMTSLANKKRQERSLRKQEQTQPRRKTIPQPLSAAKQDLALLLNRWPNLDPQERQSELVDFARASKLHRKLLRRLLKRARNRQIRPRGFQEGARTPGSNLRKIDRNTRHR